MVSHNTAWDFNEELFICRWAPSNRSGGWQEEVIHTDSDTKLLYCEIFLFKMSEQGPKTRSNLARSSLTHFSGPRDTTVAALGRSSSKAISPAEKPSKSKYLSNIVLYLTELMFTLVKYCQIHYNQIFYSEFSFCLSMTGLNHLSLETYQSDTKYLRSCLFSNFYVYR